MSPSPEEVRRYGIDLFLGGSHEETVPLLPVQTIAVSELHTYSTSKDAYTFPPNTRAVHYFPKTSFTTYWASGRSSIESVSHFSLVDRLCGVSKYHNEDGRKYSQEICQWGDAEKTNLFDLYGITFVPSKLGKNGYLAMGEGDARQVFHTNNSTEKIEHLLDFNDGLSAFLALPVTVQQELLSGLKEGEGFLFGRGVRSSSSRKGNTTFELQEVMRTVKIERNGERSFSVQTATPENIAENLPVHLFMEGGQPTFKEHLQANG